jgi:hypothetical protein
VALTQQLVGVAALGQVHHVESDVVDDEPVDRDELAQLGLEAVVGARVLERFEQLVSAGAMSNSTSANPRCALTSRRLSNVFLATTRGIPARPWSSTSEALRQGQGTARSSAATALAMAASSLTGA